jgi:CTP synthase (UTP-ammonia lyase)
MPDSPVINVLMDLPPGQTYHVATMRALDHAASSLGLTIDARLITTDTIDAALVAGPGAAVVVGPGSPYREPEAVHEVVRSARERGVPLLGT